MKGLIKGLHHVTATVKEAQEDYDFYTKLLGQRLVKETVNFDNEAVYHFYYGNKVGTPSTIFTTFPYAGQNVHQGIIGTGQVYETTFIARKGSLEFWKERLEKADILVKQGTRFDQPILTFDDPSGLHLSIVEGEDDRNPIWVAEGIPAESIITGIESVTLLIAEAQSTLDFLKVFGYDIIQSEGSFFSLSTGEGKPGDRLFLREDPSTERGKNGLGTVHHVAHRVEKIEDSLKIKETLEKDFGLKVTEVKDRKYFKSIYFRIPGGVLFEVATIAPGFTVDESEEALGTALKLPDWQEPHRERISNSLPKYVK